MDWIQLMAGIMFVIFGLLSLKEEEGEGNRKQNHLGPIITCSLSILYW